MTDSTMTEIFLMKDTHLYILKIILRKIIYVFILNLSNDFLFMIWEWFNCFFIFTHWPTSIQDDSFIKYPYFFTIIY